MTTVRQQALDQASTLIHGDRNKDYEGDRGKHIIIVSIERLSARLALESQDQHKYDK